MKVRFPKFDFAGVSAHWAPDPEFAQGFNAASLIPAHVEPYLLKVMRVARERLHPSKQPLINELDIFCKQEMQHMKHHLAYNKLVRAQGYEGLAPIEAKVAADFERFLSERSLRFNLAYCEGFESMSASACEAWFEEFDDYLADAHPAVVGLWRWHLAEEFEHRTVCSDVYHELSGLNPIARYFYRIYGYFYALIHLGRFQKAAASYLLARDREKMTKAELVDSLARERAVTRRTLRSFLPMMLKIVLPTYDPAKRRVPSGLQEYLIEFENRPGH
jgi:predicted metal-dependent hydrolase